jgi:hypothetical protein
MHTQTSDTPRLAIRGIRKVYPSVIANDGIDLTVMPGEIHAVLGENGAGKSTLMKVIYGVIRPDEGEILWEGQPVTVPSPAQARELGIGMVFQHFSLFETLSVVQNVALSIPGKLDLAPSPSASRKSRTATACPVDPAPAGPRPVRGRAAAGGDHPLPAAEPQAADPGRAHLGADAPGRAQAVRDAAAAGRRRREHPLHQPQAGRDPGAVPQPPRSCGAARSPAPAPPPRRRPRPWPA